MRGVFVSKLLVYRNYLASTFLITFRSRHVQARHILKMNEAFLRYEKDSKIFDITFRFADEEKKVDRQFNFSRQAAESVNTFLKRIETNVSKIINKKVRKIRVFTHV